MTPIKARFVCINRQHQLGQFQEPPGPDGKPKAPELKPITDVRLVPDAKSHGTEDLNHPVWNGDPNGMVEFKFGTPEAMAGFEPGKKYIVTIEALPDEPAATIQ
jgi:hypothetical protein